MGDKNAQVEKLKALLGITGEEKDLLLEFALENAEETVKNYCHIKEIPEGLWTTLLRMAADIYRNEQLGNEDVPQTVTAVKVGDTSTSFGTQTAEYAQSMMKNYKSTLNQYRKVVFR